MERRFWRLYYDSFDVCKTTVKGTLKKLVFVDFFRGDFWITCIHNNSFEQNLRAKDSSSDIFI